MWRISSGGEPQRRVGAEELLNLASDVMSETAQQTGETTVGAAVLRPVWTHQGMLGVAPCPRNQSSGVMAT